ncbi:MAG: DUF2950 domain-containing protein [Candidatus Rokuibacteriota bacterium]
MLSNPIRCAAQTAALAAALVLGSAPVFAQRAYPTPEAAAEALTDAVARSDGDALRTVLGADWKRFIPTAEIDQDDVYAFLADWAKSHKIVPEGADKAVLAVGDQGWTLPIPLVKDAAGWKFDPRAGADEMRTRRIGRNELATMQAALAYFDAQKEYALRPRTGDGVLQYAQRFVSTPGKRDGLFWPDPSGRDESPLGPLYGGQKAGAGYHGYHYRILKAQGKDASGGAYDYLIKGRMVSGFALVAWPIRYGDTGVMSFVVSHDGVVYQKDLGPSSDTVARAMTRFNPDSGWTKVAVPGT